jgi:hypothetical protein
LGTSEWPPGQGLRESTGRSACATWPSVDFWHGKSVCAKDSEKMKYEYEGESHDVIENKGQIFISHDVYDK